jgi:hypothetical protein
MLFWAPNKASFAEFEPKTGWNASFTEQDKIFCTNTYVFLKNIKEFEEKSAEVFALMATYKNKFPQLKYSSQQENDLLHALIPIIPVTPVIPGEDV